MTQLELEVLGYDRDYDIYCDDSTFLRILSDEWEIETEINLIHDSLSWEPGSVLEYDENGNLNLREDCHEIWGDLIR